MLKTVALSAGLIAGAHAFWRMECPGRVGLARLDPIVNPHTESPHVHAIHGSSGTYFHSIYGLSEIFFVLQYWTQQMLWTAF